MSNKACLPMLKRQKSAGELKIRETKIVRTPSRKRLKKAFSVHKSSKLGAEKKTREEQEENDNIKPRAVAVSMSATTPTLVPRDRKFTIGNVTDLPTDSKPSLNSANMNSSNNKSDKRRSIIELNLIDQNHVKNALKAKWQQAHPNSFFADFVRLSRNVEIIDEEGDVILNSPKNELRKLEESNGANNSENNASELQLDPTEKKKIHLVHMRDLLCYLKVALDEPQDNIVSVLDTFIVDANLKNDDIKHVSNFFTNVYLKSPEDIERDIVLQLLKAITNQAFVAPAYWALKTKFVSYPVVDVSNSWRIVVEMQSNNHIQVTHMKRGKSQSQEPEDSFEFAWELIVTLYRNNNRLDIENVWLKIKDFEFNAAVELEKKMEIVMIAKNLFGAANVTF
eukprot:TRINITY_DN3233_c0_g1_i1.p1 TRINITY_DN3233_c0_g1~~TRINITY_DN3233_c0_g1_i1.p1  ORF type:complete len:395 (-),score=88.36 TRINITY_DN3233_c0_g1_i1:76-1260(-)